MKKKNLKKILVTAIVAALSVGVLAGCGGSSSSTSASSQKSSSSSASGDTDKATTLNIAYQPVVGYLPLYLLKDEGRVEEALKAKGYDVKITYTEFESGPPENEAFASGLQDIGVMGNVPAISGIASGQKRSIIGIAYNGEKTEAILVPQGSSIKSVKDLKGKKIGVVVGSIAQNLLNNLFEKNGLTFDDVELVNLSTGEQESALVNGQVDAVATWEPTISKIVADKSGSIIADGTGVFLAENPIVARTEYVEANPEITQIFLDTYKKAAEDIKADPDKYADKYADTFGLDKDVFLSALDNSELPVDITDDDVTDLQKTADFLKSANLINTELKITDYVKK